MAQHTWAASRRRYVPVNLDYHPHLHLCITDGVFTKDGDYYTPWDWKPEELKEKLRRKILKAFVRWEKLTPEAADVVACWDLEKCGFSLFIGSPIGANERERLARLLRYLMRSPVSFKRLRYDEGTGKVEMRLKHDKTKVFNHAIDFLAALARHVPKARQHLGPACKALPLRSRETVTYAGHYANATGNLSRKSETDEVEEEQQESGKKSGRYIPWNLLVFRSWAAPIRMGIRQNFAPAVAKPCGERSPSTSSLNWVNS